MTERFVRSSIMNNSRKKSFSPLSGLGVLAVMLLLGLTACGTAAETSPTPPEVGTDAPSFVEPSTSNSGELTSATFAIGEEVFEFSPTLCMLGEEDVMVQGPGTNTQTGEVAFLDVDFTSFDGDFVGGADIELGTDEPFTSPDEFYRLDPLFNNEGFALTIENGHFTAEGLFFAHDLAGSSFVAEGADRGVLQVQCGA